MLGLSRVLASPATLHTADTNTITDHLLQLLINHFDVCNTKSLKSHSLQLLATSVCYSTSTQAFQNHTIAKIYCSFRPFPYCPFQQSFYTHLNIAVMENFGLSEKLGWIKNNSEIYLKNV